MSQDQLSIDGRANGARFDTDTRQDIPVSAIDYGNLNCTTDESSGLITINQGYRFGGVLNQSSTNLTGQSFHFYVLDTITANTTFTLPTGTTPGDSVKITNLSTTDSTGMPTTSQFQWTIMAQGSERIMRATTGLVLDDPTASFELIWTGDPNIGWVLNGIN